jgi:hypothetical protein
VKGNLGLKLAKDTLGQPFVADLVEGGVLTDEAYLRMGIRPGLQLKMVHSIDGYTRQFKAEDSLKIWEQQLTMVQRPYQLVFEPVTRPLEYTFSAAMVPEATASDKSAMKKYVGGHPGDDGKGYSILRQLGMSLLEEDIADPTDYLSNETWVSADHCSTLCVTCVSGSALSHIHRFDCLFFAANFTRRRLSRSSCAFLGSTRGD